MIYKYATLEEGLKTFETKFKKGERYFTFRFEGLQYEFDWIQNKVCVAILNKNGKILNVFTSTEIEEVIEFTKQFEA